MIVNVDDFGLTAGVNQAVEECFVAGSVSSATLLVAGDAATGAAAIAKRHPGLGVGLHFNLTLGRPVSEPGEVSTIVDGSGCFFPRKTLLSRAVRGQVNPDEVSRELEAQAAAFFDFGLSMTHVDSHQHAHLAPRIFDVVAAFCERRGTPLRMPRVWRPSRTKRTAKRAVGRVLLRWRTRSLDRRWAHRLRTNRSFASVFDCVTAPSEVTEDTYRDILAADLQGPFELMVHPAVVDANLERYTRITAYSTAEYRVLRSLDLGEMAAGLDYRLATFRDAFAEA